MPRKQTDPQFKLRLPEALKARLEAAAAENNRSLSSEIVQRLDESFDIEGSTHELRDLKEEMRLLRLDTTLLSAALDMPSRDEILKRMAEKQLEPMSPEGYQSYLLFIAPKRDIEAELEKIRNGPPKPDAWT